MLKFLTLLMSGLALVIATLLAGLLLRIVFDTGAQAKDWRTASSEPAGWAPAPDAYAPALVQAYCAPAFSWRGAFSVHCWIAAKPSGASQYRRYEVIGYRLRRTGSAVIETDTATPDREWYGSRPKLLQDIRGAEAEKIIATLPAAVASYPYPSEYRVWPGPNSNTFIAHVAREVPELRLALPGNAIGKDYVRGKVLAPAPSGTGFQISVAGLFGVLLAEEEGFEVNILGLVIGAHPMNLAITIPGVGRIPFKSDWTTEERDVVPSSEVLDGVSPPSKVSLAE